ncbi:MAG: bifunctional oligoribonuclease/PAP phosphatase NrnA [Firmicutes bacterium]|nr:bifunctional oligoribonuclease/PAP phosphatase NrnA [Bacillota bacterium]
METFESFSLKFQKAVESADTFLLMPHVNMDGDALGSVLAVYLYLKAAGKKPYIFTTDRVPVIFDFMPGIDNVRATLPDHEFDCAILFECPSPGRCPCETKPDAKVIINIDHHPDNSIYGDLNYVDPSASSVGEIFYELFSILDIPVTREMAINLYVAIYTDTGGFKFKNTTSRTHKVVSKLLENHDVPIDEISRWVEREMDHHVLLLLGKVISNITVHSDGISTATLDRETMESFHADESDVQNFMREIFRIRGVHTMALLRENSSGAVKVSLRSSRIPVNKLAAQFGGGGHPRAAGCTINGASGLFEAERTIVNAMRNSMAAGEILL